MVNVKQNKVEEPSIRANLCELDYIFLQIYLQICKETTNFADEYGQETDNQTRV